MVAPGRGQTASPGNAVAPAALIPLAWVGQTASSTPGINGGPGEAEPTQ